MQKKPRVNKSKEAIASEIAQKQNIDAQKKLARRIFPYVEKLDSVRDAQTAFGAAAGYIKYGLLEAEKKLKVSDIEIDLSKEKPDGDTKKIVTALKLILNEIKDEPAGDMMRLTDLMGSKLPDFLANKGLQGKMSQVKLEDYIAD